MAKKTLATLEDLLAIPEGQRFHELLAGEIVQKAMPSIPHGDAQLRLGAFVQPIRRGGGGSAYCPRSESSGVECSPTV